MLDATKIVVVISMVSCSTYGNQQHLVCKTVGDILSEGQQPESTWNASQLQGPPGIPGIQGIEGRRGLPGPQGPPAIVDYGRINKTIDETIASVMKDFKLQVISMLRNLSFDSTAATGTITNANVFSTTATACSDEGMYYAGKCYTLFGYSMALYYMDYNAAKSECAKHGALMAEIHDRAQQDALIKHIRSKYLSSRSIVEVWVGMEYKKLTSTMLYRSGKQVGTHMLLWIPNYPHGGSSNKYIAIDVRARDDQNYGLFNKVKQLKLQGVVCEKAA